MKGFTLINRIKLIILITFCSISISIEAMQPVSFLQLGRETSVYGDKAVFTVNGQPSEQMPYFGIIDPSYDQTFKKIFDLGYIIKGINGEQRLRSLLNSLLYPTAQENDFQIRKISSLSNESTNIGSTTPVGSMRFDIACRCECWALSKEITPIIFDIEMQTSYEEIFSLRLMHYANELLKIEPITKKISARALAFFNPYQSYRKTQAFSMGTYFKDSNGQPTKPVTEGGIMVDCIDLPQQIEILLAGGAIKIDGNLIEEKGKQWLKLLGLRQWCCRSSNKKYILPESITTGDAVIDSVFSILQNDNNFDLAKLLNEEEAAIGRLEYVTKSIIDARAEGEAKGRTEGERKAKLQMAITMLNLGESMDKVVLYSGLSEEEIQEEMQKETGLPSAGSSRIVFLSSQRKRDMK